MKIHHLNCGTFCPMCQKLINGTGGYFDKAKLVCHCLLIEHKDKLVLVDTGFGVKDVQQPQQRLGRSFTKLSGAKLDLAETAFYQIKALGYDPQDVSDIFPTHLDLDHVGGLSDFPQATVHVYHNELRAAMNPSLKDSARYRHIQYAHNPLWQHYHTPKDEWFGLPAFDCREQLGFGLNIVPLTGHTLGHVGIAVEREQGRWLLHCGDAYFHHSQVSAENSMPKGLAVFEQMIQANKAQRVASLNQLKRLKLKHPEIDMFCAHDVVDFERFQTA